MKLGDKVRQLRMLEGVTRGLDRDLTQSELSSLIHKEQQVALSQSYISQIEKGQRQHLSNTTRVAMARFFGVHPGYLIDDIEGMPSGVSLRLRSEMNEHLDVWLVEGATEHFRNDASLHNALLTIAKHPDSRACLILLAGIVENQKLLERLFETNPATTAVATPQSFRRRRRTSP